VEMGPGRALSSLAQANGVASGAVIPALRHPEQAMADDAWHVLTIARLWACGVPVDWAPIWGEAKRNRVELPTYAFQRKTYFIEPGTAAVAETALPARVDDIAQWGWRTHWQPRAAECDVDVEGDLADAPPQTWLIFTDDAGLGMAAATRLRKAGHTVTTVRAGDAFARAMCWRRSGGAKGMICWCVIWWRGGWRQAASGISGG
jgi:acyl transferase domain-containing protein